MIPGGGLVQLAVIFINNIAPILLVAGVGFTLGRRFNIEPKGMSQLIFNAFSPALVFSSLYTTQVSGGELGAIILATAVFQLTMGLIAYLATRLSSASKQDRAAVMVSAFCFNAGNYGLSLVKFAFGPEVFARAVIVYIANVMLNYSLGVFVASSGRRSPLHALRSVAKVPALYATAAAFLVTALHIELPLAISRPIELLGNAAIPCMLILLGLELGQSVRVTKPRLVGTGVTLRLLVSPLVALVLVSIFAFQDAATAAFIIQTSMPVAVMTVILATEFNLDHELMVGTILMSTISSPITLSVLILLLRTHMPGLT